MCIQQHKTIQYETVDGKSGSLQVSNTSTEEQDKLLLKKHLQETQGYQEGEDHKTTIKKNYFRSASTGSRSRRCNSYWSF